MTNNETSDKIHIQILIDLSLDGCTNILIVFFIVVPVAIKQQTASYQEPLQPMHFG
jgi:flagellar assembly factor FliW